MDDQVAAIVGDFTTEAPILMVGPLVDQCVVGLRRAKPVKIKFVEIIHAGKRLARSGLVIAAVVKSAIVPAPGRAGKLDPMNLVGKIAASFHVAHLPVLPVRAG